VKIALAVVLAFVLAVVGSSAMPYVKVLGVTPDLVLIFAACWAVVRGQDEGLVIVPAAGFVRDLTTSDPLGTSVIALMPIVLLSALARMRAIDSDFMPCVIVIGAGSAFYGIISMIVLSATGRDVPMADALMRVTAPSMIVNPLFTPIVYLPVHWLAARSPAKILGPGRITSPL